MARKVVGDRLQAITDLADEDRAKAAALATEPLVDNLGSPVGQNLADAAALVDAIVQRVESHVSGVENRSATEVAMATRADGDLTVAERLADQLGSHINRAAQLRGDLAARRDLPAVAKRACRTAQRTRTEQTPSDVNCSRRGRRSTNASSRSPKQRPRCVSWRNDAATKIMQAPTLAVPSVAAVGPFVPGRRVEGDAVDGCARRDGAGRCQGRAIRSSAVRGRRRFQQPIDARDDLRGLLQAFRGKAAVQELGEEPISSRCTARRSRCCGRRRAISLRHARWSSDTWPP